MLKPIGHHFCRYRQKITPLYVSPRNPDHTKHVTMSAAIADALGAQPGQSCHTLTTVVCFLPPYTQTHTRTRSSFISSVLSEPSSVARYFFPLLLTLIFSLASLPLLNSACTLSLSPNTIFRYCSLSLSRRI